MYLNIQQFDWIRYLHEIFIRVNVTVNETGTVVVYAPEYLKQMIDLVEETEER